MARAYAIFIVMRVFASQDDHRYFTVKWEAMRYVNNLIAADEASVEDFTILRALDGQDITPVDITKEFMYG